LTTEVLRLLSWPVKTVPSGSFPVTGMLVGTGFCAAAAAGAVGAAFAAAAGSTPRAPATTRAVPAPTILVRNNMWLYSF
jgi:hypothetical protein